MLVVLCFAGEQRQIAVLSTLATELELDDALIYAEFKFDCCWPHIDKSSNHVKKRIDFYIR